MPLYIAQSGDLDRCYRCLTDRQTTLKDRATQLLIKYKSGALVTQFEEKKTSQGISLIQGGVTSHGWQMVYGSQSSPMLSHWCRSSHQQSTALSIASRRDHRGNARSTVRGRGGCWEWSLVMVKTTKASQFLVTWQVLHSTRNCRFCTTYSLIFGKFYGIVYGDFVPSFGREKARRWLH